MVVFLLPFIFKDLSQTHPVYRGPSYQRRQERRQAARLAPVPVDRGVQVHEPVNAASDIATDQVVEAEEATGNSTTSPSYQ